MAKNIVVIPWVNRESSVAPGGVGKSGRTTGYEYGVNSWNLWCEKNDVTLFVMDESALQYPESDMVITWQRWYILDMLKDNEIDYNQVLICDADSIVHPDCPNFFNETDDKFSTNICNGDFEWVNRAIRDYSRQFFDSDPIMMGSEFFQTGFVILNESHIDLLKEITDFYWEHKDKIIESYGTIRTGSDQPLFNLLTKLSGVEINYLPDKYSMMDLHRKNLLYTHPQHWWGDTLDNLYNTAYIYQFNAIPQNPLNRDRAYWMGRIYNELWGNK